MSLSAEVVMRYILISIGYVVMVLVIINAIKSVFKIREAKNNSSIIDAAGAFGLVMIISIFLITMSGILIINPEGVMSFMDTFTKGVFGI